MITSWAGIRALISLAKVSEMHVDFLLFIPKSVTEYATIYTSVLSVDSIRSRGTTSVLR